MKQSPLKKVSKKQQAILRREAKQMKQMLEESDGMCWVCGQRPAVEPSHTRDRKRFKPSCRECHYPNGEHKYLGEET